MLSGYTCASTIHLQVWDLAEGRVLRELRGHTDTITNLAWGSDSRQILYLDPWLNNNLLHRLLVSGGREGAVEQQAELPGGECPPRHRQGAGDVHPGGEGRHRSGHQHGQAPRCWRG